MIAYKFLARGAVGPFSGFCWPIGTPGPWVTTPETAAHPCFAGIHGCTLDDLPYWLHDELWQAELDGPTATVHKLVAPRGRLVASIETWDDAAKQDFAGACLARSLPVAESAPDEVRELATAILDDVARHARSGRPATVAFCSARLAEIAAGPDGYDSERAAQVAWLVDRLALPV